MSRSILKKCGGRSRTLTGNGGFSAGVLLICALLTGALIVLPAESVLAEPTYYEGTTRASVEDHADILSDSEESALLEQAGSLSADTGFEIRVVTTDDAYGMQTYEFAENYFEALSEDYEGACYVLDLDNREYYVATYGDMRYILTDDRIDTLVWNAGDEARSGDWAGTLSSMLSDTAYFCGQGVQSGTALYDEETGEYTAYELPKSISPMEALLSAIFGGLGFLTVFSSTKARYKMKGPQPDDYSAKDNVSLELRRKQDTLVNRHVSQRRIPRNNGGGHGGHGGHGEHGGGFSHVSSVHHTSGGHSAGGGGGHF